MGFQDQTRRATARMDKRMKAAAQLSVQRVVERAERVEGEQGGRMRIDTGFLRASGGAALGTMPRGPARNPGRKKYPLGTTLTGMPLPVALAQWDFTKPLNYGWTANYALAREAKDKFVVGAAQLWPRIVKQAISEVKSARV